jgi:DNA replication protein DnaC
MKKQQEEQKQVYGLDDFKDHCHLWNVFTGGNSDKAILKLRKIIDAIQSENFSSPYRKRPSFLIIGEKGSGKSLVARAIANSLALEDIREAPGRYFDNGMLRNI